MPYSQRVNEKWENDSFLRYFGQEERLMEKNAFSVLKEKGGVLKNIYREFGSAGVQECRR